MCQKGWIWGYTCWVGDAGRADGRARPGNSAEGTPQESHHSDQTADLPGADSGPFGTMACPISHWSVIPSRPAAQQLVVVRCCVPHELAEEGEPSCRRHTKPGLHIPCLNSSPAVQEQVSNLTVPASWKDTVGAKLLCTECPNSQTPLSVVRHGAFWSEALHELCKLTSPPVTRS